MMVVLLFCLCWGNMQLVSVCKKVQWGKLFFYLLWKKKNKYGPWLCPNTSYNNRSEFDTTLALSSMQSRLRWVTWLLKHEGFDLAFYLAILKTLHLMFFGQAVVDLLPLLHWRVSLGSQMDDLTFPSKLSDARWMSLFLHQRQVSQVLKQQCIPKL